MGAAQCYMLEAAAVCQDSRSEAKSASRVGFAFAAVVVIVVGFEFVRCTARAVSTGLPTYSIDMRGSSGCPAG